MWLHSILFPFGVSESKALLIADKINPNGQIVRSRYLNDKFRIGYTLPDDNN